MPRDVRKYAIRKGVVPFLFVLAFLAFVSCGKVTQTSSKDDTLDRIRRTGQIDACVVVDPPFVIKDAKTGLFSGVNINMMNLIASKMNAKVTFHETAWGNVAADLASNRCDVMSEIFFANIPRALSVAFTMPADTFLGLTAIARKNDSRFHHVKNPLELDRPDVTVSVAVGTAGDFFVKDNFKRCKVRRIDIESSDLYRFFTEVSSSRSDVALAGSDEVSDYVRHHPEVVDLFHDHPFSLQPIGWAVRQRDEKWLHFLETSLQFLDTQGTIAQLEKKYDAHLLHLVKQYKLQ